MVIKVNRPTAKVFELTSRVFPERASSLLGIERLSPPLLARKEGSGLLLCEHYVGERCSICKDRIALRSKVGCGWQHDDIGDDTDVLETLSIRHNDIRIGNTQGVIRCVLVPVLPASHHLP